MRTLRCLAAAAAASVAVLASPAARAEGPTAPGYERQETPQNYPTPLSQTTQPSYVPQSVALSGPREIGDYEPGDPIPPGYRPVEKRRKGLIIGGAVTFGTLYLISALVAAGNADATSSGRTNPAAAMWIPAVGPFIQMTKTDSAVANVFLAIDGLAQTAGVAMLVVGLTTPRTVLVRNDLGKSRPTVRPVPLVAGGTTGLGLVGTF